MKKRHYLSVVLFQDQEQKFNFFQRFGTNYFDFKKCDDSDLPALEKGGTPFAKCK